MRRGAWKTPSLSGTDAEAVARAKALAAMPTGLADRVRAAMEAFRGPKTITNTEDRK
jgi:hypothetical protein